MFTITLTTNIYYSVYYILYYVPVVSLIAFPIPTIGVKKSLGATLIAAGLVQERTKHMHVTDVYSTFQDVSRELRKLQQKSV
jgi:hypothetical protein